MSRQQRRAAERAKTKRQFQTAYDSDPRLRELVAIQAEAFREKFGREMGPGDPILFDPDADTPQPLSQAKQDEIDRMATEAMVSANIRPELIYAYKKTGRMVTTSNRHFLDDGDRAEWDNAIDEYFQMMERKQ